MYSVLPLSGHQAREGDDASFMGPSQDHFRHFRVLAKGPLALKDCKSLPRALADMISACLITRIVRSHLMQLMTKSLRTPPW